MIDPSSLPPAFKRAMERKPALREPFAESGLKPERRFDDAQDRCNHPKMDIRGRCVMCGKLLYLMPAPQDQSNAPHEPAVAVLTPKPKTDSEPGVKSPKIGKIVACCAKAPPKPRAMNKTERRFADMLDARKRSGEILHWVYEGIRLKWGGSMHYTGDFVVFNGNDCPTIYEVKGAHIRDRDIVRFKGARNEWPQFPMEMWQWKEGKWTQKY
jgi:hypothetical protein